MSVISFVLGGKVYGCPSVVNLVVRHSSWRDGDWKLRSSAHVLRVPLPSLVGNSVPLTLLLSTKKARDGRNQQINAVGYRLGKIGIGAQLLPKADKDQRLNQLV
jgi:hypothetical protein